LTLAYEDEFANGVNKLGYAIAYPNADLREADVWNKNKDNLGKEIFEYMFNHGWSIERVFADRASMRIKARFSSD
jgi:hypothetical protein